MSRGRPTLELLPPLVVGVSAAGAAEMSAGLLLYSSQGFLPALTLILTVETGALALGLWSGSVHKSTGRVESLRKRWLFSLVAFALAAAFSMAMTLLDELVRSGLGQGLALAFLGSLPLFALGALLGGMVDAEGDGAAGVAVPSVVGLALGFLLTGGFLLPNLAPYTLYLLCLSALSAGALLQGWLLDAHGYPEPLDEVWSSRGLLRVEDRAGGGRGETVRVILEGGRVRGAETPGGGAGRGWENAVLAAVKGEDTDPGPVLYLGGGSGTLGRLLLEVFPETPIHIIEGSEALVSLARKHFHPFPGWPGVQLQVGHPWRVLATLTGNYPLVLVDQAALPSLAGLPDLSPDRWEALARLAGPGGTVVLGGLPHPDQLGALPLDHLLTEAGGHFSRTVLYQGEKESFILLSGSEAPSWSPVLPGFHVITEVEE